jgi:hypothetical protein
MSFFYDLNKKLNGIGAEQKKLVESKQAPKTPARQTLEQALRSDLKSLMEDGTGGMNFSGSGSLEEKAGYSAKKAAAGKDIGKPGKNFAKIEKSAAKKYGSKEAGERVAGAVLNKLRHPKESIGQVKEAYNPVKAVKQCAKSYMEMNGIHSVHDLEAEDIESIGGDCQMNYQDVCEILGCNLPDSLGPVKSYDEHGDMEESALQAYLGNKKYGKQGMDALRKAGREHAGKDKMDQIRNRYDKMDEMECDNPTPSKGIPGNMPVKGKMDRLNGKRDYYEEEHSEEDIMDYLNRKLAPHDKQQQAKEDACAVPYNKGSGKPDAKNGMEFEGNAFTGKLASTPKGGKFELDGEEYKDDSSLEETVSRKHFQQVADLLKNIPDEAKRKEMALHHASIFKQQNPRFDIRRFAQAAGVDLEECAMWEELKGGQVKLDKNHDGKLDANDFAMLRKGAEETDEGWDDAMAVGKAAANQKPAFSRHNVKDTGYSKVYTRKPETFDEPEDGEEASADAPKRGRPATGKAPNRKTKGAYKHKVDEEGEEMVDEKAEQGKRHFFDKLAPAAKKVAKVVGKVVGKEDVKAEKAGKKVAKDIEHDEGHKGKDDNKYDDKKDRKEKKTEDSKPDYIDLDKDGNKKETMKKAAKDKEEKVDETTTSSSIATATTSGKSSKGGINYGGSIYDSWNRQFETLLAESVNVSQESAKMEDGNEEESITINVTGDDVARFKEVLASMGLGQQTAPSVEVTHDDSCGTCGGTPCQCDEQLANANGATLTGDELDEADVTVSQNEPDYPSNEEESDDALQYSGGLNGPKSTGQTTIPVVASQQDRLHTMKESEDVDSFLNLYQSFKTK